MTNPEEAIHQEINSFLKNEFAKINEAGALLFANSDGNKVLDLNPDIENGLALDRIVFDPNARFHDHIRSVFQSLNLMYSGFGEANHRLIKLIFGNQGSMSDLILTTGYITSSGVHVPSRDLDLYNRQEGLDMVVRQVLGVRYSISSNQEGEPIQNRPELWITSIRDLDERVDSQEHFSCTRYHASGLGLEQVTQVAQLGLTAIKGLIDQQHVEN